VNKIGKPRAGQNWGAVSRGNSLTQSNSVLSHEYDGSFHASNYGWLVKDAAKGGLYKSKNLINLPRGGGRPRVLLVAPKQRFQ